MLLLFRLHLSDCAVVFHNAWLHGRYDLSIILLAYNFSNCAVVFQTAFVGLGHGLNDLGKMTIDGLGDLGNFAVDGLTDIGQSIGNGFKDAGESIVDGLSSKKAKHYSIYISLS